MSNALGPFRETHIYNAANLPVAEVLADLREIGELGRSLDAGRASHKKIFFISLPLAILSFFFGIPFLPMSAPIILIAAALCIYGAIRWAGYSKQVYEPRLPGLALRTLKLLQADMAPNALVNLRLDLRPHEHPEKLLRAGDVGPWKVKFYLDPWLRMTGRLVDGAAFRLSGNTHWQARRRWKKSASGKSKMKTKKKEATVFSLRLKFKPRKYPRVPELGDVRGAAQMPAGVALRRISATADAAFVSTKLFRWDNLPASRSTALLPSGAHAVAMMFLSLYQVLNLSKTLAAGGKGGEGR